MLVFADYTARPQAAASRTFSRSGKQKKGKPAGFTRARRLRLAPRQGRPAAALGSVGAGATHLAWQAASARQTNVMAQERRKSAWSDQEAKVGAEAIWATPKHVCMHVRRPCLPENEEAGASAFEEGSTCHQAYPFPPISAAAIRPLVGAHCGARDNKGHSVGAAACNGFARQSIDRIARKKRTARLAEGRGSPSRPRWNPRVPFAPEADAAWASGQQRSPRPFTPALHGGWAAS